NRTATCITSNGTSFMLMTESETVNVDAANIFSKYVERDARINLCARIKRLLAVLMIQSAMVARCSISNRAQTIGCCKVPGNRTAHITVESTSFVVSIPSVLCKFSMLCTPFMLSAAVSISHTATQVLCDPVCVGVSPMGLLSTVG